MMHGKINADDHLPWVMAHLLTISKKRLIGVCDYDFTVHTAPHIKMNNAVRRLLITRRVPVFHIIPWTNFENSRRSGSTADQSRFSVPTLFPAVE